MFDVTAVGELLIDFTPAGKNEAGCTLFAQNPGGAPANVLVAVSRLGGKTAFIGKVGSDGFGEFLKTTLDLNGVSTENLVRIDRVLTTLAFVQLDEKGDRSFSFCRNPGADILLTPENVNPDLLHNTHFLHFGSVSLTDEPSRSATLHAVRTAKSAGAVISYDPNYRAPLWSSEQEAMEQMSAALPLADLVKLSEDELKMLTGETDFLRGAKRIEALGAKLVLVTLGAKGVFYLLGDRSGTLPTYRVKTVDTNGAGDTFLGAVLFRLKDKSLRDIELLSEEELLDILSFANAAGSLATTKSGAIPAMPTREEVERCQKTVPLLEP